MFLNLKRSRSCVTTSKIGRDGLAGLHGAILKTPSKEARSKHGVWISEDLDSAGHQLRDRKGLVTISFINLIVIKL